MQKIRGFFRHHVTARRKDAYKLCKNPDVKKLVRHLVDDENNDSTKIKTLLGKLTDVASKDDTKDSAKIKDSAEINDDVTAEECGVILYYLVRWASKRKDIKINDDDVKNFNDAMARNADPLTKDSDLWKQCAKAISNKVSTFSEIVNALYEKFKTSSNSETFIDHKLGKATERIYGLHEMSYIVVEDCPLAAEECKVCVVYDKHTVIIYSDFSKLLISNPLKSLGQVCCILTNPSQIPEYSTTFTWKSLSEDMRKNMRTIFGDGFAKSRKEFYSMNTYCNTIQCILGNDTAGSDTVEKMQETVIKVLSGKINIENLEHTRKEEIRSWWGGVKIIPKHKESLNEKLYKSTKTARDGNGNGWVSDLSLISETVFAECVSNSQRPNYVKDPDLLDILKAMPEPNHTVPDITNIQVTKVPKQLPKSHKVLVTGGLSSVVLKGRTFMPTQKIPTYFPKQHFNLVVQMASQANGLESISATYRNPRAQAGDNSQGPAAAGLSPYSYLQRDRDNGLMKENDLMTKDCMFAVMKKLVKLDVCQYKKGEKYAADYIFECESEYKAKDATTNVLYQGGYVQPWVLNEKGQRLLTAVQASMPQICMSHDVTVDGYSEEADGQKMTQTLGFGYSYQGLSASSDGLSYVMNYLNLRGHYKNFICNAIRKSASTPSPKMVAAIATWIGGSAFKNPTGTPQLAFFEAYGKYKDKIEGSNILLILPGNPAQAIRDAETAKEKIIAGLETEIKEIDKITSIGNKTKINAKRKYEKVKTSLERLTIPSKIAEYEINKNNMIVKKIIV